MPRRTLAALLTVALSLALGPPALPCSLCGGNYKQKPTLREEAAQSSARLVLYGSLQKPRLNPDGSGVTELQISEVLKNDTSLLAGRKVIELPRYVPVADPKDPPRFLVFCDAFDKDKLDPYRGTPLKNAESLDYARKSLARDPRERAGNLVFYFNYLENADKEVAADAFLEFAKATDQDIAQAAPKLAPDRLRRWVKDPQVSGDRLALYATLLGACGGADDADLLKRLLADDSDRVREAFHGVLGGYMHLKPTEGWELALAILADGRKPIATRIAVVRTLRFYQGAQPEKSRPQVLKGLAAVIAQGELADMAVDDLIRYRWWDLTPQVLGVYGKKGYDAPLMQRAILRYALLCKPTDEVQRFLAERRRAEPDVVKEVEELLQYEKK
jgi:hypothetical protein